MTKQARIMKEILNSKDIIQPHQLFSGLNLTKDDFLNLNELFEISRRETVQKFIQIRNIGNSIIQKDGFLQGICYSELEGPKLTLVFKNDMPPDWHKRLYKAQNIGANTSSDGKGSTDQNAVNLLRDEQNEYKMKNKEILEQIERFALSVYIRTNKYGKLIDQKNDQYDNVYPTCSINYEFLDYLLNAANLGSELDIALVRNYKDELKQFKEGIDAGFFYPDFKTIDYTGTISIQSRHTGIFALKPNNSLNIPSSFGQINVYFNNPNGWKFLKIDYDASTDRYDISSDFKNDARACSRIFVHKPLLPEAYQKKLK
ncbi:MAG: hypothetical protein K2I70_03335 [Bacilli bacterium]|nr:hypothetical protein [Bacilli bacterium]